MSGEITFAAKGSGNPNLPVRDLLAILKKYREKSSIWFLLKWVFILRPMPDKSGVHIPGILRLIGQWNREALHLYRIHVGLRKELGSTRASIATLEIYRTHNQYLEEYKKRLMGSKWQRLKNRFSRSKAKEPQAPIENKNIQSIDRVYKERNIDFRTRRRLQRWQDYHRMKSQQAENSDTGINEYPRRA